MFLLYFYNQVLGLDPFLCGLGIALSLFVDAFTDPMIGGISDRSATRFGRRIPIWFRARYIPAFQCPARKQSICFIYSTLTIHNHY